MYGALIGLAAGVLGNMMKSKGGSGGGESKSSQPQKLNYNPGTYNSPRQQLNYGGDYRYGAHYIGASRHRSWLAAHRARHGIKKRY